jgi:hypothetical protein
MTTRYIYICSSGHSGSTLLEMFLAGHPEMTAVGELVNLNAQMVRERVCSCGVLPMECPRWIAVRDGIRERCGADIFTSPWSFPVSLERPQNHMESALRLWARFWNYLAFAGNLPVLGRLAAGADQLIRNTHVVIDLVRRLAGTRIVVDSSKDYLRMRELYASFAPGEMKVIYLTRDGRGCLWSSLKRNMADVPSFAREWATNQRRTLTMLRSVRRQDQYRLHYEALCIDPETTLRKLCRFFGVDFDPAMLALSPDEHHTIAGNRIRTSRGMTVRVDTSWQENLTAAQLVTFDRIAGEVNRQLGYLTPDPVAVAQDGDTYWTAPSVQAPVLGRELPR